MDAKYYTYKVKCTACNLHFAFYSDYQKSGIAKYIFCPECGIQGKKMMWGPIEKEGFIFQSVPGSLDEMSKFEIDL